MKRVIFRGHGDPQHVLEIVEEPDPLPGPGQVRVRNHVMTINPADLLTIEGRYGSEPVKLPFTPGFGAYGTVDAVGDGVERLSVGDVVLPVGGGLWSDTIIVQERMAPRAPDGADREQAAMMRANPGTAYLMLRDMVPLSKGDWIIQNAANSSVGRLVIGFAKEFGYHTLNIVRRDDVKQELLSEGADLVVVDDGKKDISSVLRSMTDQPPRLALDAIGGEATSQLASSVCDGGTVVVYGLLSGIDSRVGARDLVFRNVDIRGFWLSHWFANAQSDRMRELNQFLVDKLKQGLLQTPVEARYPIDRVKDAVAHAARSGRNGKILLLGGHDA